MYIVLPCHMIIDHVIGGGAQGILSEARHLGHSWSGKVCPDYCDYLDLMIMGKNLLFRTVKEHQAVTKEVKEKKLLAGCHISQFQILMAQVIFPFV